MLRVLIAIGVALGLLVTVPAAVIAACWLLGHVYNILSFGYLAQWFIPPLDAVTWAGLGFFITVIGALFTLFVCEVYSLIYEG